MSFLFRLGIFLSNDCDSNANLEKRFEGLLDFAATAEHSSDDVCSLRPRLILEDAGLSPPVVNRMDEQDSDSSVELLV